MAIKESEAINQSQIYCEDSNSPPHLNYQLDLVTKHDFHITKRCIPSANVVVIIPAYNEEVTIGSVVLEVKKFAEKIVVIDDGSIDLTAEIAESAGADVIKLDCNHGKAYALMKGFNHIREKRYSAVVMMDADGQHKAYEINSLIEPILKGDADLVIGSRFLKEDNSIPAYRVAGQKLLNRFTNIGSRQKMTDTQSGFRAISKKGLENLDFQSDGYCIESDMIVHFSERGLKIIEIPTTVRYDVPNGHKHNSVTMGIGLLNNVIATIGYKRPLLLFGVPGLLFVLLGLTLGTASILHIYLVGSWIFQALLSAFFLMLGSVLAVSALTLNSLASLMRAKK